jgi:hypothetical protein
MAEKQMELELDWQTALLALKHHIGATKVRMDRLEKMFREAPEVTPPTKPRRKFSGNLDATVAVNFGIKLTVVEVHGGPWDYVLRDFNDHVLEFGAAYMIVGRHSDGHREIVNIAMLRRADYKIVVNIHLDASRCFAALYYKGGKMFETELKEVRDAPGSTDCKEPLQKP